MKLEDMLKEMYDDATATEKPAIVPKPVKQSQDAERSAQVQGQRANEFNQGEFNKYMMKTHPKVTFGMLGIGNNLVKYQNLYLKFIKTGGVVETTDLDEISPDMNQYLDDIEKAKPTAGKTAVAKGTGTNLTGKKMATQAVAKRTDKQSQTVSRALQILDKLEDMPEALPYIKKAIDAIDAQKTAQAQQGRNPGQDSDSDYRADRMDNVDPQLDDSIDYELDETLASEIPVNVLSNIMTDDKDVPLIRQALRQIQNERGINKRFMPALKQFLKTYVNILSSGFTGYNQMSALEKALVKQDGGEVQDPNAEQDPNNLDQSPDSDQQAQPVEPTEQEITDYAKDNDLNLATPEQREAVKQTIIQKRQEEQDKIKIAASKYSEAMEELKTLSGLLEAEGKMPSKSHVMDMCKDGMSFAEMCKMHPEADKDKLKAMVDKCKEQMKESVSEAMSDAYGEVSSPDQVEGSVEFKQHKNTDKGSVSVEASGETMQDLADVLKLAGLTLPKDMHSDEPKDQEQDHEGHDEIEKDHVKDGEKCDCCGNEVVDGECGCGPECPHCGGKPGDLPKDPEDKKVMVVSPQDASMSTDKEVLVNYLKDKLKKSIS